MSNDIRYKVHTHWGCFSLDEASYRDYLAGKLWISWKPGNPDTPKPDDELISVSAEAVQLRESAQEDAYSLLRERFPNTSVTPYSFVEPQNVKCECDDDNRYLFIPKWMLYSSKFDEYNLPPRDDEYYDLTDEEYLWVKMSYGPEKFHIDLRQQSFLGAAGYSTGESEIRRHSILAKCVHEYGKGKVIRQLKVNINLRAGQKNKNFGNAINIWRGDIWYVEHKL